MSPPRPSPLTTAQDLLAPGSSYPEHGELWDGRFVAQEPSGGPADFVSARVVARLVAHVDGRGLGWVVASNQGFLVARDPDRVLSPDGAFVSRSRLPAVPARGFIDVAPDFVVEVRSPDDASAALHAKAGVWIGHGVPVVWAVDPLLRTVTVHRAGEPPCVGTERDEVGASPALPEFTAAVKDLFAGLLPPVLPRDTDA